MADLKKGIDKLIEAELQEVEAKKAGLLIEVEALEKKCIILQNETEKEIAAKKAQCEIKCNEDLNAAAALLKEAKEKNETADKRKEDSVVIEKQIKDLEEKSKAFKDKEKEIESLKISCLEKEKTLDLLIEQETKKLEELNKKE